MELREADKIFAAGARTGALARLLGDSRCRRISLEGLAGSAPAMLFAGMEPLDHPAIIIADDITAAGYLYNDLCRIAGDDAARIFPSGYRRDIKYGQPDPSFADIAHGGARPTERKESSPLGGDLPRSPCGKSGRCRTHIGKQL